MLTWNVITEDVNAGKIRFYNIFNHGGFYADLYRKVKDYKKAMKQVTKPAEATRALEDLKTCTRSSLMYYFWSKCEWEIVATSWPTYITVEHLSALEKDLKEYRTKWGHDPYRLTVDLKVAEKLDVYTQVMQNYDAFIDYILGHINEFKKPKTY